MSNRLITGEEFRLIAFEGEGAAEVLEEMAARLRVESEHGWDYHASYLHLDEDLVYRGGLIVSQVKGTV